MTGIAVDAAGSATVAWSLAWGREEKGKNKDKELASTPYTKGEAVTLPKDMDAKSTFIVRTELSVPHTILLMAPGLSSEFRSLPLERTSFFRQREGDGITCSGC